MSFSLIQEDITNMNTDCIVNATDTYFSGQGQVDYSINSQAGAKLKKACKALVPLDVGEAKSTKGYELPEKYIIHTSGPHWSGGTNEELTQLKNCYINSIKLARKIKCKSIAFPIISSHGKGFPKELALIIAINTISEILSIKDDIDVYLLIFKSYGKDIFTPLLADIQETIKDYYKPSNKYAEEILSLPNHSRKSGTSNLKNQKALKHINEQFSNSVNIDELIEKLIKNPTQKNLNKVPIEENFATTLSRILKEKKLKQASVYDELGMSNVGFWKILKGNTNPTKKTVFALAIALRLTSEETKDLLMKAGYAINPSSLFDVILSKLIQKKVYDRFTIDELLYSLDLQSLPGAQTY